MKTALLASVVAILSACGGGGGGDSKPTTQATNTPSNAPVANNNSSGNSSQASNTQVNNTGSQVNNQPSNSGSQVNNQPSNSGSQAISQPSNLGSQTIGQPSNSGSQTISQPSNLGSQTTVSNGLTLNENPHLFANENKFLVKAPTDAQKQQLAIALTNTNKLRAEKGLPALKYDATLAAYAQRRAEEIVGRFDHKLPDSNSDYYVNIAKGGAGENIAAGGKTGAATIEQWRNSKGHYENMIRPEFTKIGIGVVHVPGSQYGYYWVQIFGYDNTETNYVFDNSAEGKQTRLYDVTAKTTTGLRATEFLWVDNTQIQLRNFNGNGSWQQFSRDGYNAQVAGYQDVRFGTVKNGNANYQVFYFGKNTDVDGGDNMPQTGSANYTGKAVITDGKTLNNNLDAQFKADFGNKKLTGVLSDKGQRVVDINAHIRGSSFHSPQNAPVETQGSFFGTNANELGGVFHENATGKFGAFGAKR